MIRTHRICLATPHHDHTIHDAIRRRMAELAREGRQGRRPVTRLTFAATA